MRASDRLPHAPARRLALARCAAVAVIALAAAPVLPAPAAGDTGAEPIRVVYHFTLGLDEARRGLGNVRNHLAADPKARIVVVGNGLGIDFLLDGARDAAGNPFDATVQDLKAQGVDFRLCANTLRSRKIDPALVLPEATVVPSGVAEAARLQAREGFVYLRP